MQRGQFSSLRPLGSKLWVLLGVLLWASCGPMAGAATGAATWDGWYRVDISGQRAGWMHLRETSNGDEVTSTSRLVLELRRGDVEQRVEMASRFVESRDGKPRSAWSKQVLGSRPVETHYVYSGAGIEVETRHGDDVRQQRLPLPEGAWLSPGEAQREIERQLKADVESFALRTVDPQLGAQPLVVEWKLQQRSLEIEAAGRQIPVSRWQQTQNLAPQMATLLDLDAEGRMVRSSVQMMGLEMVMLLTSEQDALADNAAPEVLLQTFLRPDRPIDRPRQVRRGVYLLTFDDGDMKEGGAGESLASLPLPTSSHQYTEVQGKSLRVVVDMALAKPRKGPDGAPADGAPTDEAPTLAPYLTASTYLNYEDPVLRRLLVRALDEAPSDAAKRAEKLRLFVAKYLADKNLASVLATASEVAAQRSGDCTEHSVLLAALLRGDGIPSRVAAGLVYVKRFVGEEDFFGYHMWTQALIGGRWVDLDATLGGDSPFDGTHIMLATSALDDDKMALMELARVAPWVGRAEITVVEVSYGEKSP